MKRRLSCATILALSQAVLSTPSVHAQASDAGAAAAGSAPASAAVHHHRHHHRHAVAAAGPADAGQASPSAVPVAAEPAPAPGLTPIQAMATVKLPDTGTQEPGAGPGLTALGAIRAGNAEGTIPAWTGGQSPVPGRAPGSYVSDAFISDKPLLRITAQNVDRYVDKLAVGTVALIRTLHNYHVDVYPTHRTAAAPQFIYDNAIANMSRAHLVHDGQGVEGAQLSVPFPIPHNGNEAMWDAVLRWRGSQFTRTTNNVISTPSGDYSIQRWHEDVLLPYGTPGFNNSHQWDAMFRQQVLSPPRDAGLMTLVINHENPYDVAREAWTYTPGERRVRRAPEVDYDTPFTDTDGLETIDDYDLFNGALDRYDWTLVGRREMYVPYNTQRIQDPTLRYADLINRDSIKPEYIRFELHRVWMVEAKLKPEFRHIYTRRTIYLDEDSWCPLISDRYDGRGQLWRTAMAFTGEEPNAKLFGPDGYEFVDLYQHRFLAQGLHNQEPVGPIYNMNSLTPRDFTAESLRRLGLR